MPHGLDRVAVLLRHPLEVRPLQSWPQGPNVEVRPKHTWLQDPKSHKVAKPWTVGMQQFLICSNHPPAPPAPPVAAPAPPLVSTMIPVRPSLLGKKCSTNSKVSCTDVLGVAVIRQIIERFLQSDCEPGAQHFNPRANVCRAIVCLGIAQHISTLLNGVKRNAVINNMIQDIRTQHITAQHNTVQQGSGV